VTKKKAVIAYIPKNEHPFIMVSIFVFKAKSQGWTDDDLKSILKEVRGCSSKKVWSILKQHMA